MKILSYDDLRTEKGIAYSRVHLWRFERDGKFPKRVPLGQSRHGWVWLLAKMADADMPRE